MALPQKRKHRGRWNAYVDIDSITVESGSEYCNWIKITKKQLKQRERALMDVKRAEIELIINKENNKHNKQPKDNESKHLVIPPHIFNVTLQTLNCKIDDWSGVDLSRTKSSITRYRDYFKIGKNWIGQIKRKILGDLFWFAYFQHIRKSCNNKWFELNAIAALFNGKVTYSNTKATPLINGSTLLNSQHIAQYLKELHPSLQLKQWIREQEIRGNYKKKAKAVTQRIQSQLNALIVSKAGKSILPILGMPLMPENVALRSGINSSNVNTTNIINHTRINYNQFIPGYNANINHPQTNHMMNSNRTQANNNYNMMNVNRNMNHNYGIVRGPSLNASVQRYSPMNGRIQNHQSNNTCIFVLML